jgi:hypothetical protein
MPGSQVLAFSRRDAVKAVELVARTQWRYQKLVRRQCPNWSLVAGPFAGQHSENVRAYRHCDLAAERLIGLPRRRASIIRPSHKANALKLFVLHA